MSLSPDWELLPYCFRLDWVFDPDFGWLQFYYFSEPDENRGGGLALARWVSVPLTDYGETSL